MKSIIVKLGLAFSGLTLKAQPLDEYGQEIGAAVSTSFTELGQGEYLFKTSLPNNLFKILDGSDDSFLTTISFNDPTEFANFAVTPISSTVSGTTDDDKKELWVFQQTATALGFAATDKDGNTIPLDGHTARFILFSDFHRSPDEHLVIDGDSLVILGNSITVNISTTHTAVAGKYRFALRDLTLATVLATGTFDVRPLPSGGEILERSGSLLDIGMMTTEGFPAIDELNIVVYQDANSVLSFTVEDGEGEGGTGAPLTSELFLNLLDESGSPLALEGHSLRFVVFDNYNEEEVLFVIETPDLLIGEGAATIPITPEQTATPGKHSYALRDLTTGSVLCSGTFDIRALPGGE